MKFLRRQSAVSRLLSALQSVVLIAAVALGSHAHSNVGGHHHHAVGQVDAMIAPMFHGDIYEATSAIDARGRGTLKQNHADCMDFHCHGGLAIVATDCQVMAITQQGVQFPCRSEVTNRRGSFSLDRPPKAVVLA